MKKSIIAIALSTMFVAGAALAQQTSYYLQNDGRIQNNVSTYAAVNGEGTSNSVANGNAMASSGGTVTANPIAGGMALGLSGWSATTAGGMAFNVSTGSGYGSALTQGWTDSRTFGDASFANEHGSISLVGATDSGMTNPVRNGVDYIVNAGTSQDGFANGAASGSFNAGGSTSQLPVAGGAVISANVWETKESQSSVAAGAVTFTGGVPAGQSAAVRNANAGNDTLVSGQYVDPFAATAK